MMINDEIKIDLQVLRDEELSPNQYCTLWLLNENRKKDLYTVVYPSKEEVQDLVRREYCIVSIFDSIEGLDKLPDEVNLSLDNKGLDLFKQDKKLNNERWAEFLNLYPKKQDTRPLHDKLDKNKKLFMTLIKKEGEYDNIITGLKNEIKARSTAKKKGNWFQDWKLMSTWLNNKNYTLYLDYQEDDTDNSKVIGI